MKTAPHQFPTYTKAEWRIDAALHVIGIAVAPIASLWLLTQVSGLAVTLSLVIYCLALIATLSISGAYNMLPNIRAREFVRRADHAMIFVMIAGTYTPITLNRLPPELGLSLGLFVWLAAAVGIWLALVHPHRYHKRKLALYVLLGWSVLVVIVPLSRTLTDGAFNLLLIGGFVYSLGAVFHAMAWPRFHNAIWHGLVLLAAGVQFAGMACEFIP